MIRKTFHALELLIFEFLYMVYGLCYFPLLVFVSFGVLIFKVLILNKLVSYQNDWI